MHSGFRCRRLDHLFPGRAASNDGQSILDERDLSVPSSCQSRSSVVNILQAFLSVLVATIITMISAGVESKGYIPIQATTNVGFQEGFLAVTNIIFAYLAHVAYFGFMSETEDPRTFNKSLAMLQIVDTVLYLVSAMIIYRYVGPGVKSPAIVSLSPLMSKIAWGIAIPTVSAASRGCFVAAC